MTTAECTQSVLQRPDVVVAQFDVVHEVGRRASVTFVCLVDLLTLGSFGTNHVDTELSDLVGEGIDLVESLVESHLITVRLEGEPGVNANRTPGAKMGP